MYTYTYIRIVYSIHILYTYYINIPERYIRYSYFTINLYRTYYTNNNIVNITMCVNVCGARVYFI